MKKWLLWILICILCLAILLLADKFIRSRGLKTGINNVFRFLIVKKLKKGLITF